MKIPTANICRVELIKMLKRKDYLSLLGILGIGILFAASILTEGYAGAEHQSALFWIVTQMLNSSILLVSPMILVYSAVRTMAQEIENGSLKLFDQRIGNRESLYLAKAAAAWIYSSLLFLVSIGIHMILYFMFVGKNERFGSNQLFGENTAILLSILLTLYLSTFVLIPQLVLFLGTFAKPGACAGILFLLVLVAHNIYKVPVLGLFSPWTCVIRLAGDVMNRTDYLFMSPVFMMKNIIAQLALCGTGSILCIWGGARILRRRDL